MFKVVDNRQGKDWEQVEFGDVVITENDRKYLVIDISLHDEKRFIGFLDLEEGYVSSHSHYDYKPECVDGQKIVEVIKAKNVKLTLGE
ncbi:hypothetical protein [Bacillus phage vB_BanS-Thrax3]|nr:hypothetical protein [Bacillus phage vB_BanS-Thrax3]